MTIGQVAKRAGVQASAIRYYEAEGLLPAAARRSGRRVYDASILDRLAVIELAKAAGFTVAETKRLMEGVGDGRPAAAAWTALAREKIVEIDRRMEALERMKTLLGALVACDCPTLDDCGRALGRSDAT